VPAGATGTVGITCDSARGCRLSKRIVWTFFVVLRTERVEVSGAHLGHRQAITQGVLHELVPFGHQIGLQPRHGALTIEGSPCSLEEAQTTPPDYSVNHVSGLCPLKVQPGSLPVSLYPLARGTSSETDSRANVIVVHLERQNGTLGFFSAEAPLSFRHSTRSRPLKLLMKPFCTGLPGSMHYSDTLYSWAHRSSALPRNSGPLSHTTTSRHPRTRAIRSGSRTTCAFGSERSTAKTGHS